MKKIILSTMLLASGVAAMAATTGTGVMTAELKRTTYTEEQLFTVNATYDEGVLTLTGFPQANNNKVTFYIDLGTGDVESANLQSLRLSDFRKFDYKIYGEIENTDEGKSIMTLNDWGNIESQFFGQAFVNVYLNTTIVFDFQIEDLEEPETGPVCGEWMFEVRNYGYIPAPTMHLQFNARLKEGSLIFTPVSNEESTGDNASMQYLLPIVASWQPYTNQLLFNAGVWSVGYMGSYEAYVRGIHFVSSDEFEGYSFLANYDEDDRSITFEDNCGIEWLLYRDGKMFMEIPPLILVYAEQITDGRMRSVDIADVNQSDGVFTVKVSEFGLPHPENIKVWYRVSSEGDFSEAKRTEDLTYTFDLNGLGLAPGSTYDLYIYANVGRVTSPVEEYLYTCGEDEIVDAGVGAPVADDCAVRYYDLMGTELQNPTPGTICIKVENNKVSKVIVK